MNNCRKLKMNATIITFHCTPNYGATLQTIAMYKLFSKFFERVFVLDYRPLYVTEEYRYLNLNRFRGFVASLLNLPFNLVKYKRFSRYLNSEVELTRRYNNKKDIRLNTDCLILGSDQIWNLDIAGYDDSTYFGKIEGLNVPIISYAASIGNDTVSNADMSYYRQLVSNIDYIGVRENRAKEILTESGIKKDISVVLDPTFLLSEEDWRQQEKKIQNLPKHYILVYSLLGYEETYTVAEKLSNERSLPIIEIMGRNIDWLNMRNYQKITTAGPREFTYAIDNADYVVTDSFHGTAFSIIFNRKFLVIPHKKRGGRMIELLTTLGLQQRIIRDPNTLCIKNVDDFVINRQVLDAQIEASRRYITQCIEHINND